jgi:GntR family transcriptional regulator/MocR family aminotransferase
MWSIEPTRGSGASAVFVRIAAAVTADIRRGVLRAGDRLPSTRALATELGVTRNTVVAAYDELLAQGWVQSRGAAGTFVTTEVPERSVAHADTNAARTRRGGIAPTIGYALDAVPPVSSPLGPVGSRFQISAGVPDPRVFPHAIVARAYRRALRSTTATAALGYGDPCGTPQLRTAIAAMLRATRAIPADASNILVTRGSQMALDLAARALLRPGDVAAVEALGYQPAFRAFAAAGARLVGVPIDTDGLVVDRLPMRPRLLYATPHHQYPTTVLLSSSRRLALLDRARCDRFAIVEDDYDHEFHFDGRPVAPLASADRDGTVIYVGSLSKILAPGLRLGFIAAPEPVIATLAAIRAAIDRQGDHVLELAVAELVADGEIHRHAHKQRRIYAARRDAFVQLLRRHLGGALAFELPAGGITLWARVDPGIALERWRERAFAKGVHVAIARDFALDRKPRPFMRLAFARYTEAELAEIVGVLASTLRR